jgi:pilin isopeptide linkage protein
MPAFAADGDNTSGSTPITALKFTKTFTSETSGALPQEDFYFTMTPATVAANTTYNNVEVKPGLDLATSRVEVEFKSSSSDSTMTKDGQFNFTLADNKEFTGPAVYSYVVKEEAPSDQSVTYDTTEYTVYVVVNNNKEVTAVVNVSSKKADETTATEINQAVGKKPITFTNTCATDSLVISKVVSGSMANMNDSFKFQIVIPVEGAATGHTIPAGTKFTGTITRAATNTSTETVDIVVKNEADLSDTENVFELKNGDYITINNLPEQTIYKITELGAEDYTTSIVGKTKEKDATDGTLVTKEHTVASGKVYDATTEHSPIVHGGNTVQFTNKKDMTPTGLAVEYGPHILVLLIAVGVGLVIFKSRRKVER